VLYFAFCQLKLSVVVEKEGEGRNENGKGVNSKKMKFVVNRVKKASYLSVCDCC
jgi:hypothetical protein